MTLFKDCKPPRERKQQKHNLRHQIHRYSVATGSKVQAKSSLLPLRTTRSDANGSVCSQSLISRTNCDFQSLRVNTTFFEKNILKEKRNTGRRSSEVTLLLLALNHFHHRRTFDIWKHRRGFQGVEGEVEEPAVSFSCTLTWTHPRRGARS